MWLIWLGYGLNSSKGSYFESLVLCAVLGGGMKPVRDVAYWKVFRSLGVLLLGVDVVLMGP
jgi:hypothetical protein